MIGQILTEPFCYYVEHGLWGIREGAGSPEEAATGVQVGGDERKMGRGGVRKIFGVYFEAGTSRCLADGLEVGYKRESHHRE